MLTRFGLRHWEAHCGPLTLAVLFCRRRGWPPPCLTRAGGCLLLRAGPVCLSWWRPKKNFQKSRNSA